MNPVFKSKYDQMRESTPAEATGDSAATAGNGDQYAEAGHIRNLCFVWPDGKRQFLNYSYLVTGEYLPQRNTIILEFTTHAVTLTGLHLKKLYDEIMMQLALRIICTDARFNALETEEKPLVNDIQVVKSE